MYTKRCAGIAIKFSDVVRIFIPSPPLIKQISPRMENQREHVAVE
jgi:hypothetical protein